MAKVQYDPMNKFIVIKLDHVSTRYATDIIEAKELAHELLLELYRNDFKTYTVLNALMDMVTQYLADRDGTMRHDFMSAGENSLEVLQQLGLVKEIGNERYIEVMSEGE